MNHEEDYGHSSDESCLSFGQLLVLIAACCTGCLLLGRAIGMSWISSIAFAYVGGATLVIVGCLIALRLVESGVLAPLRQTDPVDEWTPGRHIDMAHWSSVAREGTAAAPVLGTVERHAGAFGTDPALDPRAGRPDAL